MPQVAVRRPFRELDLHNDLWLKPDAIFHLLCGQCPLRSLLLGEIGEWTFVSS